MLLNYLVLSEFQILDQSRFSLISKDKRNNINRRYNFQKSDENDVTYVQRDGE